MYNKSTGSLSSTTHKYSSSRYVEFFGKIKNYDPSTSLLISKIRTMPVSGSYKVEKHGMGGRFDLISFDVYQTTELWWIIFLYNNMISFNDLKVGTVVDYPAKNAIENMILSMRVVDGMWLA